MKTLYIIRHAKSSWDSGARDDFDRPLNKRGKRDAPLMGSILKKKNIKPDLILSSLANRARITASIIGEHTGYLKSDIVFCEQLYLASVDEILTVLHDVDSQVESLFLIGHNPGLTDVINILSNADIDNLPTTGIFAMEFDVPSWKLLKPSCGRMIFFDYPKKYIQK